MEVLDAYDSCHLRLSGNSSHLAPWHAKLGFQRAPFVAGLTSLTGDGGVVAVVDLTVVKASYEQHFLEDTLLMLFTLGLSCCIHPVRGRRGRE